MWVRFLAASSMTRRPIPTLPVNMTVWTVGWVIMNSAWAARLLTTLRTPGGSPASR